MNLEKFIIYACPVGELAEQINLYFQNSQERCGKNKAHQYMPHCSLTGFFNADIAAIPNYLNALDQVYHRSENMPSDIKILRMTFKPKWHGLELEASDLKRHIANFAEIMHSQPIAENIRTKEWLHVSFAYSFPPEQHETLKKLAKKIINPQATTRWELRFYQQHPDWTWTCWQSWPL